MKRRLELDLHPDDYALLERAAHTVGYSLEEFGSLAIYLQSKGLLERGEQRPYLTRPTGVVHQVASWLTTLTSPPTQIPRDLPTAPLPQKELFCVCNQVGVPHE
jgi:uncharacterized protein (DUF1778 family)